MISNQTDYVEAIEFYSRYWHKDPNEHILVIGPAVHRQVFREFYRYASADEVYEFLQRKTGTKWYGLKFLGFIMYIDKELQENCMFHPFKFLTKEEFVAEYFVDLL